MQSNQTSRQKNASTRDLSRYPSGGHTPRPAFLSARRSFIDKNHVIARSEMGMSQDATWKSHAIQGGHASVRLPRCARNDIVFIILVSWLLLSCFFLQTPIFRNVIKVTCAIIVDADGLVFAAQRSEAMSLPLKWEFPGGKIEPGETAEACLIREIKEELHVDVEIVEALPFNTHQYPNVTIQLIPFVCKITNGGVLLKEHLDFKWLSKDELLALDWAEADVPIVRWYIGS
jgi:8-oxo-dGTP diphosphatase